jgi:kynureninase
VPLDVQALDVGHGSAAARSSGCCGGPAPATCTSGPRLREKLEPRITGLGRAHASPFAFETGPSATPTGPRGSCTARPRWRRSWRATAGYDIVAEVGVERIREWSVTLTEELRADMLDRGFAVTSPADPARRGGTLTIGLDDEEDGPAYVAALAERGILVDHRPEAGIRVSPHFYTRREELRDFAESMSALRAEGRWKEHRRRAQRVLAHGGGRRSPWRSARSSSRSSASRARERCAARAARAAARAPTKSRGAAWW